VADPPEVVQDRRFCLENSMRDPLRIAWDSLNAYGIGCKLF